MPVIASVFPLVSEQGVTHAQSRLDFSFFNALIMGFVGKYFVSMSYEMLLDRFRIFVPRDWRMSFAVDAKLLSLSDVGISVV